MERSNQIEFLYNAITDVQDLIKFTESKAAFVIGILTAYVAVLFLTLENIIKYYTNWSFLFWIFYISLNLFMIFCIWIIAKIIMPIKKPTDCVKISKGDIPETEFYLAPNQYDSFLFPFSNLGNNKLKIDFKPFYQNIKELDDKAIIKILTLELFKISYIRNVKSDRFKVLIYFIFITSVLLIGFYIKYQIELTRIITYISTKK
jgi:hypothetical protein